MEKVIQVLEKEREMFEKMRKSIEAQKIAMIERDIDEMNEALLRTERIAMEIDELDGIRHELFRDLRKRLGLPENASLDEMLSRLDGEDREKFIDAVSKFLTAVNDLAAELEGLKEMMEFENAYFEFLMNVMAGETRGIYDRRGSYGKTLKGGSLNVRW